MSSPRKEYDLIFKYYLVGESGKFIPSFTRNTG